MIATALLLQAQGPLWTAPLAWLEFGPGDVEVMGRKPDASAFRLISCGELASGSLTGRRTRLFEQVASTSAVVSLTLRQLGAEHAARQTRPAEETPRRLLSAHWLEPRERELMSGLAQLHVGLEWVGSRHGWSVWGAGDDPLAARAALSAMLNQTNTPFDFAAFGGHGADTAGGVLFSGGVWNGSGADLTSLDLLLLVACAVGRLQQNGQHDVEGLYARLALSEQAVTEHLAAAFDLYGYG